MWSSKLRPAYVEFRPKFGIIKFVNIPIAYSMRHLVPAFNANIVFVIFTSQFLYYQAILITKKRKKGIID